MGYRADLRDKLPQIAEICRRNGVSELLLFGSGLGPDFGADSDLDFLVEFCPSARIGLVQFIHLKYELESALKRKVDIVPKRGLKSLIRDNVLERTELVGMTACFSKTFLVPSSQSKALSQRRLARLSRTIS